MNEFSLYDRIINGDLRPHLEQYKNESGLKNIENEFYSLQVKIQNGVPDDFLDKLPLDFLGVKDGDKLELKVDTDEERPKITLTILPNEEGTLINIDIPPPPDAKAEIYLRIIKDEYNRIKISAHKELSNVMDSTELSFYAKRNIQMAKTLAKSAFSLEKKLRLNGIDDWDNSNTYITYVIRTYLIYLIHELQNLFSIIANVNIQTEAELEDELYEGYRSKMTARIDQLNHNLNKRYLQKLYVELGKNPTFEKKWSFFETKIQEINEKIEGAQKTSYAPAYLLKNKKLLLLELGHILSAHYFDTLINNAHIVDLLTKYQNTIQTIVKLKMRTSSLEFEALQTVDFFSKIQLQIDAWKEVITSSYIAPNKDNILSDLVSSLLTIQARKHLGFKEDHWNDYITDLLRAKKYAVTDQTRSGISGTSKSKEYQSGELDIAIRDIHNGGIIKTIIETLNANSCGDNETIIKNHIYKLLNRYDTAGNDENFIVILSKSANFSVFWETYRSYVKRIVFNNEAEIQEIIPEFSKADLKTGVMHLTRHSKQIRLYHLVLNMYIKPKNE